LLWAEERVGLFNTEPGLVARASTFLRIATAGYLVLGLNAVLMQCLSGVGDTLPPMIFGLVTVWLVQLPLAFLLPRVTDLGVYGIRWAIVSGLVAGASAYTVYFRMGRWKRKKV
jgi:Na+-driven multidrug efflux pump